VHLPVPFVRANDDHFSSSSTLLANKKFCL
jgi:hypothetical protein